MHESLRFKVSELCIGLNNVELTELRSLKICDKLILLTMKQSNLLTIEQSKRKLGAHAMKRIAAGAHLSTPWLFESAKRPDNRADYCLDCSFLPKWKHRVLVFTLEWSRARPVGEQW